MNNFSDYDDGLEIMNELGDSISGYSGRRAEALQDEEHDRRQDDGEEYRFFNDDFSK